MAQLNEMVQKRWNDMPESEREALTSKQSEAIAEYNKQRAAYERTKLGIADGDDAAKADKSEKPEKKPKKEKKSDKSDKSDEKKKLKKKDKQESEE